MILAGLGAEIIKLERPGSGDDARAMAPVQEGVSAYFLAINRGKKSVALDLSKPEGIAIALRLAKSCDVFLENFRGGKAERMGLGESALRSANPRIIYASLSAFGPRGPDFDKPGYDALAQARTGIQSVTGEPGTAGARAGVSILDMGSGMWMAIAILAALFDRERTGRVRRVDGSLYQTGVMWMAYHLVARQMTGRDPSPQGTGTPRSLPTAISRPPIRAFSSGSPMIDCSTGFPSPSAWRRTRVFPPMPRAWRIVARSMQRSAKFSSDVPPRSGWRFSIARAFPQARSNRRANC